MRKRFEEFSLSLNPDKTRLIDAGRARYFLNAWETGSARTIRFG